MPTPSKPNREVRGSPLVACLWSIFWARPDQHQGPPRLTTICSPLQLSQAPNSQLPTTNHLTTSILTDRQIIYRGQYPHLKNRRAETTAGSLQSISYGLPAANLALLASSLHAQKTCSTGRCCRRYLEIHTEYLVRQLGVHTSNTVFYCGPHLGTSKQGQARQTFQFRSLPGGSQPSGAVSTGDMAEGVNTEREMTKPCAIRWLSHAPTTSISRPSPGSRPPLVYGDDCPTHYYRAATSYGPDPIDNHARRHHRIRDAIQPSILSYLWGRDRPHRPCWPSH